MFRTYLSIDLQNNKLANKFLLDEYLDIDTLGNISINIVEIILTNISKIAFIKTTENIETIYTQNIHFQLDPVPVFQTIICKVKYQKILMKLFKERTVDQGLSIIYLKYWQRNLIIDYLIH
ncbi:hypothetical protein [Clostridium gasigenes]|uniref:hypothetical protein n=1 Tax=Clostridium gasigenes TaxID=94869 RepID=UPI001C0CD7B7|nr:hypothetical protein [Clostridium gasigenes]MBU3109930.1 hypothetical protein [Clostridium gasigenes]